MDHYQDDPDFIGPRLPKAHPAYRAYVERQRDIRLKPASANSTLIREMTTREITSATETDTNLSPPLKDNDHV